MGCLMAYFDELALPNTVFYGSEGPRALLSTAVLFLCMQTAHESPWQTTQQTAKYSQSEAYGSLDIRASCQSR